MMIYYIYLKVVCKKHSLVRTSFLTNKCLYTPSPEIPTRHMQVVTPGFPGVTESGETKSRPARQVNEIMIYSRAY